MKKLIATEDIMLRLLQTGKQYSFKKDEIIKADGLLADRLIKQSKEIIKYIEEAEEIKKYNIEELQKTLNSKSLNEILGNIEWRGLAGEELIKGNPTKKVLINAILENVRKQNGNQL